MLDSCHTPLWTPISLDDPDQERKFEDRIVLAKARRDNDILYQLYLWGERLANNPDEINTDLTNHRVGMFLFQYFEGYQTAIMHLSDVTIFNIDRISYTDRANIIKGRIPPPVNSTPPRQYSEEPNWSENEEEDSEALPVIPLSIPPLSPGAGELWRNGSNLAFSEGNHLEDFARALDEHFPSNSQVDLTTTREFSPNLLLTSSLLPNDRHVPSATNSLLNYRFRAHPYRTDHPSRRSHLQK
jgi:hypothetical protein